MKKKWLLILFLFILIGGGLGLFTFNKNKEEMKQKSIKEAEIIITKRLKERYSNLEKIEFSSEKSGREDKNTGTWDFYANIYTSKGKTSPGEIHYYPQTKELGSMGPLDKNYNKIVEKGVTNSTVVVIYSDKSEGEI